MFMDEPDEDAMEARRRHNRQIDDIVREMPEPEDKPATRYSFVPLPNMARVSASQVERMSAGAASEAERAYIDAAWDRIWGRS